MDISFSDENFTTRKRKSKDHSLWTGAKLKAKASLSGSSDRIPLGDLEVRNTQTDVCAAACTFTAAAKDESLATYCDLLRSRMSEPLYSIFARDVLSKVGHGASIGCLEWAVEEFLTGQNIQHTSASEDRSNRRTKQRKSYRRTADMEVINSGNIIATPSPPLKENPEPRRRSKRIHRKSLTVYKEQGTLPSNYAQFNEVIKDLCGSEAKESQSTQNHEIGQRDVEQPLGHFVLPNITLPVSPQAADPQLPTDYMGEVDEAGLIDGPVNDKTFTIDDDSSEECSYINPELELLYRNKNFCMPSPKPFATIFEEPRKWQGVEMLCSKAELYRYYDFSDGCWYRVPAGKRNQRIRKAKRAGYKKPVSFSTESIKLFSQLLERLDTSLMIDLALHIDESN